MKGRIPTLIAMLVLFLGIASGVYLVKNQQIFKLGASPDQAPMDVRVSNVTDTSFSVSWITSEKVASFAKAGKSESSLDQVEMDAVGDTGYTHMVTFRNLTPQSTYFFVINSSGDDYNNNGVAWQTQTGNTLNQPEENVLISGNVIDQTGKPVANSLVFATVGGGSLLSTVSSQNGTWLIPISQTRNKNLDAYLSIAPAETLIEISINAGPLGISSAQIYPQSAKPVPAMTIGEVHNFKNLPPSQSGDIPNASINIASSSARKSGFNTEGTTTNTSVKTVTLESVDEDEVISTTNPEFFGKGPSGTSLTITVESENPITTKITIPPTGLWSWNPPENLAVGSHKITIKWTDASGILQTLTKNFVVQAAEGPAFVSTPSATYSPKPTVTASPSADIPTSGTGLPTTLLAILGIGTFCFAFLLWRKAEI